MTRVHIKFLAHGKGSPAKASAYLLDELDHMGVVRAGVEVLRGDATTFNAVCDASPHLWKYTSGVIAWSKEDDPTSEQIKEVLDEFEKHAFAGLDPSQYHIFAVLHTDQDGSKHIHVLAPRLDIQSGKSLNIAPPGHEKHFDSLRDYFNTKYQWSRPDDLLLAQTTQEPNYVTKLNVQAKNILTSQDLETLTKKQFCKTVDNYVKTLLKTQIAENRNDIVNCIKQLDGIDSIKLSKEFLTVTLSNGKKHRLKGDFYHEQFEIGLYSERLRAEAESRPTTNELAAALEDANSVRDDYRAKREAYHSKQHAFTSSTADDYSHQIASKLDIDRDRQPITPSHKRDDSELQSTNRCIGDPTSEYRYIGNFDSQAEHRFVFSITSRPSSDHKPPVTGHQDRSNESTEVYPNPSRSSDSEPKRADSRKIPEPFNGQVEQSESHPHSLGDDDFWSVNLFNEFLFRLANPKQPKNNRSTKASDSAERRSYHQPNQIFEQYQEIRHADRNRPFFNSANRLASRKKQGFESTSRFIKEHLDRLQQIRTGARNQNPKFAVGERRPSSLDLSTERRVIQNRAGQFFTGFTAKLSNQLNEPITNAINTSVKSAEFKRHHQQLSANSDITSAKDDQRTANRPRESSLEALAIQNIANYRRRIADSEQANHGARDNAWRFNNIDRKVEQIAELISNIRIKPKAASDFINLRYDSYYPDYVIRHERLSKKQDEAYKNKNELDLIICIAEKVDNLKQYTFRAWRDLSSFDYDKVEKIIKNDEVMLKYLKCELILEPQNDRFESQRRDYEKCLATFENIKSLITERKAPMPEKHFSQPDQEPENKPKQSNDFDLGF